MNSRLSIFFVIMLMSCSQNPRTKFPRYKDFLIHKTLKAKTLALDTALLRYPFRIQIHNGYALIMDLHNPDNYFHLFRYPEMNHLVSFGHHGIFPEDIQSAETFEFKSLDSIWVLDGNKLQINRYEIIEKDYVVKLKEVVSLDRNITKALDFASVDSFFIIPCCLTNNRFSIVNFKGVQQSLNGKIPSEKFPLDDLDPAITLIWRSFIDYNSNNGVLAIVTQLGEVLEIYNLKEKKNKVLYGPYGEPIFDISNGNGIPTGIMGFSDVKVTDKHVYAVFHGRNFNEIANKVMKGEELIDGGRFIYVFSISGEPLCCYNLDRYIYGIDVNEKEGIITALDVNNDQSVVQFNFL